MSTRKIYERTLLVAEGTALVVPAGAARMCFAVHFPHEAMIKKLIVKSADNPAEGGYSVNLYNRGICNYYAEGSSYEETSSIANELAKVIPTQTDLDANGLVELFNTDGYAFRNMEGSQCCPVRMIYVEIILSAADTVDHTFEVALAGEPAVGDT